MTNWHVMKSMTNCHVAGAVAEPPDAPTTDTHSMVSALRAFTGCVEYEMS